jgi:hypothetical protein
MGVFRLGLNIRNPGGQPVQHRGLLHPRGSASRMYPGSGALAALVTAGCQIKQNRREAARAAVVND